jgi:hypothetical protein
MLDGTAAWPPRSSKPNLMQRHYPRKMIGHPLSLWLMSATSSRFMPIYRYRESITRSFQTEKKARQLSPPGLGVQLLGTAKAAVERLD